MSMGMRPDEVRPLLVKWGHTQNTIRHEQERLQATEALYEAAFETLRSPALSHAPRSGEMRDCVAEAVERLEDRELEEKLQEARRRATVRIIDAMRLRSTLDTIIETLPRKYQQVLQMKYEDDRTWASIFVVMELSETTVRRYENEAVNAIAKKMNRNEQL